ncbi:MAG: hypothetical protein M3548_06740 [Actinomycetota bacterium]|nr:hypothetical protein [Actinomycetota bacterium]
MRRALVLGGTGMLAGCVHVLVRDGWHVVLPSRRHAPIATEPPGTGRALWVAADWSAPQDLAARAERALGGPADLLIAWVADSEREAVLNAVEPLLAANASVVEVHTHSTGMGAPEPVLAGRPTHVVVLGYVSHAGRARWLHQREIADGVMTSVARALAGRPPGVHQVGEPMRALAM